MEWNENLSVDFKRIYDDHKELFRILTFSVWGSSCSVNAFGV
jgi:hemerythrin